ISRGTTFTAGVALTGYPHLGSRIYSRGDLQVESPFPDYAAFSMTSMATILDKLAGAMTLAAGARYSEKALLETHLAVAVAGGARGRTGTLLSSTAIAFRTCIVAWNFDLGSCSESGFLERQLDIVAKIRAPLDATATAAGAEEVAASEDVAENVAEVGKYIRIESETTAGCRTHAGMPETVVLPAFLRIAQDRVRFCGFLESFFGFFVIRIAIRVVLKRELAVGAFDFLFRGVARNAQHVVIVAFSVQSLPFLGVGTGGSSRQ